MLENIKKKLEKYNQMHLLKYFDELNEEEQNDLLNQIDKLDFSLLDLLSDDYEEKPRGKIEPLGAFSIKERNKDLDLYTEKGLDAIRNGKLGAVLLAGGQGTRLGFDGPKGTFNIGVNKELYIFECLINNLMEVTNKAGNFIHLYIMTSKINNETTIDFFNLHNFFGYNKEYVHFFIQELTPAVGFDGKILLADKGIISQSPNGNGGWFSSLEKTKMLDHIKQSKIEWLNAFSVDNVLQKIADPVFVGSVIEKGYISGGKVVKKAHVHEGVGVLCLEDKKPSIVEYYEMTDEMINLKDENGELIYNFGVILNYLFNVEKLIEIQNLKMPLHTAKKKVPFLNDEGVFVKPEEPNAYKFETLILDMVHMMDNCLSYEVDREKEFAPLKNKIGIDSVDTVRELLTKNEIDF